MYLTFEGDPISLDDFLGKCVHLHGAICVAENTLFLPCHSSPIDESTILVKDKGIIKSRLLSSFPPFCGGPFLYCEDGWISGVLIRVDNHWCLEDITYCRVSRPADDESPRYDVLVVG